MKEMMEWLQTRCEKASDKGDSLSACRYAMVCRRLAVLEEVVEAAKRLDSRRLRSNSDELSIALVNMREYL